MHRDVIAEVLSWVMLGFMLVAAVLYFFPVVSWKIAAGVAIAAGCTWAWMLSTLGKPGPLDQRLTELNRPNGVIVVGSGLLLVGDQWGPNRNDVTLKIAQPGQVEFAVAVDGGIVTELVLRASSSPFESAEIRIAVDTGFISLFDSAWMDRGLSERSISKDVKAVLSSHEPLHLVVRDSAGVPAGLVVASGLGNGVYVLEAAEEQARIRFMAEA